MGYVVVTLAAGLVGLVGLVVGFVVGKRATRWCPVCGLTLSVDHCPAHGWPGVRSVVAESKAVWR